MGGVGSFNRQNRTLYIGRIKETRDTAEIIEEHFSEFGEIERSEYLSFALRLDGADAVEAGLPVFIRGARLTPAFVSQSGS